MCRVRCVVELASIEFIFCGFFAYTYVPIVKHECERDSTNNRSVLESYDDDDDRPSVRSTDERTKTTSEKKKKKMMIQEEEEEEEKTLVKQQNAYKCV